MFIASCIPIQPREIKPVEILPPEPPKIEIRHVHPPTERIFTCLEHALTLSPVDKKRKFNTTKEAFIASNSNEDRLALICLSLARMEDADVLNYAEELIIDMQNTQQSFPDMQGLTALLSYFTHLQQKRISDIHQAQQQIKALKIQLEELKSIEKILNERKNIN